MDIERFCNDVASDFLLPPDQILDRSDLFGEDLPTVRQAVATVASDWNVSEPAVTYRFARNGWIDARMASTLFQQFAARWRREKERIKKARTPDESGPSYYVVRRHRLGPALLGLVRRALQGETLSHTKAAKILGVSSASVAPLLRERLPVR
jgi:Zn-dependent peptidase ImmA (M78 family)